MPPGVDVTDQTVKLSRYVSTLLNFAPRPIGSPARGAGSFAAVGLNNTYSLLPITSSLRPQPLVGNGFIRSACCIYCRCQLATCSRGFDIVFPLRSLRGRCRLRQMRCYYIRAVGATLFQYVSVLPELKSIAVGNGFIRSVCDGLAGNFRS